jgi:hypothetical protein
LVTYFIMKKRLPGLLNKLRLRESTPTGTTAQP